jgi:hypothetical protein
VRAEDDSRKLTEKELTEMIRVMKDDIGLDLVTVYTEGTLQLGENYNDIRVETDMDAIMVMNKMVTAEAIGVSSSGFVIAPLQIFKGSFVVTTNRAKATVSDMIMRHGDHIKVIIVE